MWRYVADMNIILDQYGWGEANPGDLLTVLCGVQMEFANVGVNVPESVCVFPSDENFPRTLSKRGPRGEHQIYLSSRDRRWAKHIYQFAHEYCHVFTKHYKTPLEHPNHWIDEVLCEAASHWCLLRFSEKWNSNPPYENWRDYAPSLKDYSDNQLEKRDDISSYKNIQLWLSDQLCSLRINSTQRSKNTAIASVLLPLFIEKPELWGLAQSLNDSESVSIHPLDYFKEWGQNCGNQHLVQELIDLLFQSAT